MHAHGRRLLTDKQFVEPCRANRIPAAAQEALASELAARMNAMNSASDNAKDLRKKLTRSYNRVRQAKITSQIIEICSGANA